MDGLLLKSSVKLSREGETCLQGTKMDIKGTDRRQTQRSWQGKDDHPVGETYVSACLQQCTNVIADAGTEDREGKEERRPQGGSFKGGDYLLKILCFTFGCAGSYLQHANS